MLKAFHRCFESFISGSEVPEYVGDLLASTNQETGRRGSFQRFVDAELHLVR
jgi:hypothetical protein